MVLNSGLSPEEWIQKSTLEQSLLLLILLTNYSIKEKMVKQLASNWIQIPVNSEVYEKSVTMYDAFMLMLKPKGGRFSACTQSVQQFQ